MDDISDKELFESATTEEPIEAVEAEAPEPEASEGDGILRDEQGRFAAKAEEAEPVAAEPEPQGKDEANVPSWRLRELRERAEAAENRARTIEANFQRQFQELQARLPKPEEPKAPDVFEDPNRFLEHGVRQAVDPIRSEIAQLREEYSQKWAIKEYGEETVKSAYQALDQAAKAGDPRAVDMVGKVRQSRDPYGDIVGWHKEMTTFNEVSKVGGDLNKWFEAELERRMSDQQFQSQQLQKIQQTARSPSGAQKSETLVRLPPSIGKVPSSHSASDDVGGMSDSELFANAMR